MRSLILISVLVGCGQLEPIDHLREVQASPFTYKLDSELVPYYERFTDVYGVDSKYVAGWFADTNSHSERAVGICYSYTNGDRRIEIDPTYWANSSDNGKEQLIFHELGHCVFNLDHNDNRLDIKDYGTIPASIMNSYAFGEQWYYETFKEYYRKELH